MRQNERPSAIPHIFFIIARGHQLGDVVKLFVCVVLVPDLALKLGVFLLVRRDKLDNEV